MLNKILCSLAFLLAIVSTLSSVEPETGTLIVSYRIEHYGERLSRIRFLLISENNKEQMYPKGDSYVENKERHSRIVAIENLPVGSYKLKFLIPNTEGLFEEIPIRVIDIKKDDVVRVDQYIRLQQPTSPKVNPPLQNDSTIARNNVDPPINRMFGAIVIKSSFPDGESVRLVIKARDGHPPLAVNVMAKEGKIMWQSPPLPPGPYEILYILPPAFKAVPSSNVIVHRGEIVQISPLLLLSGTVHVTTNIPEASFLLRTTKGVQVWQGDGRDYLFQNISGGSYILSFSLSPSSYFIAPEEIHFFLNDNESKEIKANFQLAGKLLINSNVDRSHVIIQEIGGKQQTYQEDLFDRNKTFTLPAGRYRIALSEIPGMHETLSKLMPPDPIEINVRSLQSEELSFAFKTQTASPAENEHKLVVTSNLALGGFTLKKVIQENKETIGHFSGKYIQLSLPQADSYEISFDDIPNYLSPEPISLTLAPNEAKTIPATYTPIRQTVPVPEGKAIIGDASSDEKINELPAKIVTISSFAIGTYEVTNGQYAAWLNKALKEGTVYYVTEADNHGLVLDLNNRMLFKTFEADPFSQISAQLQSTEIPTFIPLPGKDSYPVINVSWFGATAYCQENNCRLPTEAEWEKAASMEVTSPNSPLHKFRYGFSRDEIDPSWANYKDNTRTIQHFRLLTSPVGFYNGINTLPLNAQQTQSSRTNLAKSPFGAFDMSGNVWEWASDWYDDNYYKYMSDKDPQGPTTGTQKVVKGGCYDSLPDGVRVTERLGLPPDYADAYTGFRIVTSETTKSKQDEQDIKD